MSQDKPSEWSTARKKPVEIEYAGPFTDPDVVETIEGDFEVDEEYIGQHGGYVIIRGVEGELYPCALDIFEDTYDAWESKAEANVEKWGLQSLDDLHAATSEEFLELNHALMHYLHDDPDGEEDAELDVVVDELDDLAALLFQLRWSADETMQEGVIDGQ